MKISFNIFFCFFFLNQDINNIVKYTGCPKCHSQITISFVFKVCPVNYHCITDMKISFPSHAN